jgi:hypothetical protein
MTKKIVYVFILTKGEMICFCGNKIYVVIVLTVDIMFVTNGNFWQKVIMIDEKAPTSKAI